MPDPRGDFTRKFDRDVLKDDSAALEELEAQRAKQRAEEEGVEGEFVKLANVLQYRANWLQDRFKGVIEPKGLSFRGRRFEFPKKEKAGPGWIEFRSHLTDTGLGIILESFMELDGKFKKKYDYITFPKVGVDVERAKKFVENKIFEFALEYQQA
jgi:hypothetical protein